LEPSCKVTYDRSARSRTGTIWTCASPPLADLRQDSVLGSRLITVPPLGLWNSTPAGASPTTTSPRGPDASATSLATELWPSSPWSRRYVSWNDWLSCGRTVYRSISRYLRNAWESNPAGRRRILRSVRRSSLWDASALSMGERQALFPSGRIHPRSGALSPGSQSVRRPRPHRRSGFRRQLSIQGGDNHFVSAHAIYIMKTKTCAPITWERHAVHKTSAHLACRCVVQFKDTLTPSFQLFKTTGSRMRPYGVRERQPESWGYVAESPMFLGEK